MLYQNAHLTDGEFLKYVIDNGEISDRFESLLDYKTEREKGENRLEKRIEVVEEQVYFARELIGAIKHAMEQPGTKKELIKEILMHIEDSYFEL